MPPETVPSAVASQRWEDRKAVLSELQYWQLSGRIALFDAHTSWRSSIHWQHHPEHYEINFLTISGQQAARLLVNAAGAELFLPDERIAASDVAGLLRDRLGWQVPLDSLRFWVIGLPVPGMMSKHGLDEKGRLQWLEQAGWQINYKRYTRVQELQLPKKIVLQHQRARIRLVIDTWGFEPPRENKAGKVATGTP